MGTVWRDHISASYTTVVTVAVISGDVVRKREINNEQLTRFGIPANLFPSRQTKKKKAKENTGKNSFLSADPLFPDASP